MCKERIKIKECAFITSDLLHFIPLCELWDTIILWASTLWYSGCVLFNGCRVDERYSSAGGATVSRVRIEVVSFWYSWDSIGPRSAKKQEQLVIWVPGFYDRTWRLRVVWNAYEPLLDFRYKTGGANVLTLELDMVSFRGSPFTGVSLPNKVLLQQRYMYCTIGNRLLTSESSSYLVVHSPPAIAKQHSALVVRRHTTSKFNEKLARNLTPYRLLIIF